MRETSHFLAGRPAVDYATQSGPMLVLNGKIHPRINADGTSAKLRNGVGVVDHDGHAGLRHLRISPSHSISSPACSATSSGCDNALFLDGSISALYAPELDRDDFTLPMGPIVGVVAAGK